ncbi:MAG: hypothetical protein ACKO7B_18865, partial [Flavobacteriales bacterium]
MKSPPRALTAYNLSELDGWNFNWLTRLMPWICPEALVGKSAGLYADQEAVCAFDDKAISIRKRGSSSF